MSLTTPRPTAAGRESPAVPDELIWRLTVDEYHRMNRAGILTDDDPVELLEGWLVAKMPKNPPHRLCTELTRDLLEQALPAGWFIESQEPLTTVDSEPEPDISVIRGIRRDYIHRHPGIDEIGMVVEVADSSLQRGRSLKGRVYARAGIPVYWILNLVERQLEVYTDPATSGEGPEYRQRQDFPASAEAPLVVGGEEVGRVLVGELLP